MLHFTSVQNSLQLSCEEYISSLDTVFALIAAPDDNSDDKRPSEDDHHLPRPSNVYDDHGCAVTAVRGPVGSLAYDSEKHREGERDYGQ